MSVKICAPTNPHLLPSSTTIGYSRRSSLLPSREAALLELPPLARGATLLVSGLRTPPVDDMSTTYQPQMASYNSHGAYNYPASLANPSRTKVVVNDSRNSQNHHLHTCQRHQPQAQQQYHSQAIPQPVPKNGSYATAAQLTHASTALEKPATPMVDTEGTSSRRGSDSLVFHSLQIPKCISPNGGNLAEFAAEMTCLFWFQSIDDLKVAETIRSRPTNAPLPRLSSLARPDEQFQKWVYTVLSTTQVTQNVVLLALLFIFRLKMSTPQIKGRAGSEYRLLTVALMLGNKFLDDNTYTNKTWAEVSCFAVQEIHVMEVEFLSNMRYNLLASKSEWEEWLVKLAYFHEYYERALRLPASPIHAASPSNNVFHSPIPSPTAAAMPSTSDLLPLTPSGTRVAHVSPTSSHSRNWAAYQANAVSPLASKPPMELPVSRKRGIEEDFSEHPAKRPMPPRLAQVAVPNMMARPNAAQESARLPVPQLTVMTGQPTPGQTPVYAAPAAYTSSTTPAAQGPVSLPPLQPGVRAMATVYQQPPATLVQPPTVPSTSATPLQSTPYNTSGLPPHHQLSYGTPNKHQSPGNLGPYGSSPMVEPFGPVSAVHTPISHTPMNNSPSVYLLQRNSPYKPIRHVNTLLYPPPSASLDQYHLAVPVQPTQMHYQPLGRRNDLRTGVVPEFVMYNRSQYQPVTSQGHTQGHYVL
ncbi:hypothetical protein S40285_06439 [Stachybotrys chlorohalonatus IBT 40285]|uniref:Cyclin N-terminal domain-containing protein n=1 Tax=Stachybotrys chlorohalonatus (strain IBT 40285) TaxID=1283841 RepID=A0A084QKP0_STAC4|nr:hypothetical protein S40285_06439 [Stachybotrys chlorohalonata IBT 40285]